MDVDRHLIVTNAHVVSSSSLFCAASDAAALEEVTSQLSPGRDEAMQALVLYSSRG
jgi:hypothetical protein